MKEQDKYLILIHKRLTEQLSSDEAQALDTWLEADAEHRALLEMTTLSWKESDLYKIEYQPDTASEWNKFNSKISTGKVVAMPSRRPWWLAAAAVLLLAGGAFWWLNNAIAVKDNWVEIKTNDAVKDVQLPDGSMVYLNKNTSIAYLENFNENEEREVKMTGEAFFEVTKNTKPFIVATDRADVRVLGTSFNVRSYPEVATEVTVATGKVRVSDKSRSQKIDLEKGESAKLTTAGVLQPIRAKKHNALAWKTQRLDFDATPLSQVFADLEKFYSIKIDHSMLKTDCEHSGDVIATDKITDVFEVLKETLHIKVRKTTKGYLVSGGKC